MKPSTRNPYIYIVSLIVLLEFFYCLRQRTFFYQLVQEIVIDHAIADVNNTIYTSNEDYIHRPLWTASQILFGYDQIYLNDLYESQIVLTLQM